MCFIAMKTFGVDANIVALSGIAIAIGTMADKKCSINSYSPVRNLGKTCQIKYWLLHFNLSPTSRLLVYSRATDSTFDLRHGAGQRGFKSSHLRFEHE